MSHRIQFRRDTKSRWAEINPVLMEGEVGLEVDTQNIKMGDGSTAWNDLEYGVGYSNVTNDPGDNENLVISQKGVTELVKGTKDGMTASEYPTIKITDFSDGVTTTGTERSTEIMSNMNTWLNGVTFSTDSKLIGHCKICCDGRNGDVYNYVFSYSNKVGVQVLMGGFGIKSDGTIEYYNGYKTLFRTCSDGTWGEWRDYFLKNVTNELGDNDNVVISQLISRNIAISANKSNVLHKLNSDDFVEINVDDLPTYKNGGYISNNGDFNANVNYYVKILKLSSKIKAFYFSLDNNVNIDLNGSVFYKDGTQSSIIELHNNANKKDNAFVINEEFEDGYVLINRTKTTGYAKINILAKICDEKILACNCYVNGHDSEGNLTTTVVAGWYIRQIVLNKEERIYVDNDYNATPIGYAYDKEGNPTALSISNKELIFPLNTQYININVRSYNKLYFYPRKYTFTDLLDKPFNFTQEKSIWFGDSITQNVYSLEDGTPQYSNSLVYRQLFCNDVNLSCINCAQGGTTFAYDYNKNGNEHGSIVYEIQQHAISDDVKFIFISGGTNDYGENVLLGNYDSTDNKTLYGALNELANYLNNNFANKTIIFLLPINRTKSPNVKQISSLNDYRQAIYNICAINNFNVVDLSNGFMDDECVIRNKFLGDGLHPTLAGHKILNKMLKSKIV